MEYKLEYIVNDEKTTFVLNKEIVTIGKLLGNDLQLIDSSVSRKHCNFLKTESGYRIVDLNSTNGTYVNGKKIDQAELKTGNNITIGRTILKFLESFKEETYKDIDDQQISIILPLSERITVQQPDQVESPELNFLTDLTALGKKLISSLSFEESFSNVAEMIFEYLNPKRLFIFSYDQKQEELVPKYSQAKNNKKLKEITISKTIAMKAIKEKAAILSSNTRKDSRFNGADSIIIYGITSAISVPIWTKDSIYGLIYIDTTLLDQIFVEKDLELISIIANFTGLSIEGLNSMNKLNFEKKLRGRLERYHSPAVVSKIIEMQDSSTLELSAYKETEASVLFMDIVGFTSKAEKMNPPEIGVFLNNFFTEMTDIIFRYNGTLDKYMGDAIMAVFGVPFEIINHSELSILAAIDMVEKLDKINEPLKKSEKIAIRIGINSGKLISGDFGSPRRFDYTVIGNTVNIASRLESSIAKKNEVVISQATYSSTKNLFEFEYLGGKKVPGISKPIKTYKVLKKKRLK